MDIMNNVRIFYQVSEDLKFLSEEEGQSLFRI